jgi:hypothetical protein
MEIMTNIIDPGKSVHFIGTPWHHDDAWEMKNENGDKIIPEPLRYAYWDTNLLSPEDIAAKRATTTPSQFAANYELRHMADEDAIFRDPTYGTWDSSIPYQSIFAHVDAKFSGTHTCGFTIMARRKDGKIQAIGWMFTDHIEKEVPRIRELMRYYRCTKIFVETNPDKGYTAKLLGQNITNPDEVRPIRVIEYHEKMDKHIKITSYGLRYWKDIVWCNDICGSKVNGDPTSAYISQVLDYREKQEPDDCPDSMASLLKMGFFTSDPANSGWRALYKL